jgi:hypothetical protein
MYFFQNTGTLHHIKDSRAYTLNRKLQFLGNIREISDEKLLGNFSLKTGSGCGTECRTGSGCGTRSRFGTGSGCGTRSGCGTGSGTGSEKSLKCAFRQS